MSIIISIDRERAARADADAAFQEERAKKYGWRVRHERPDRFRLRCLGYRAEEATALAFGILDWKRDPNGFGKPDVAGYSVRFSSREDLGLAIYDQDKQHPHIMTVPGGDDYAYKLVGWISADFARELKGRGIGRQVGESWRIPVSELWPIEEAIDAYRQQVFSRRA